MFFALLMICCAASGFALVSLGLSTSSFSCGLLLRGSLAMGYGLGLFSITFTLARAFDLSSLFAIDLLVLALLSTALFLQRRRSEIDDFLSSSENARFPLHSQRFLTTAFAAALCVAIYYAILRCIAFPQGDGWDAFAIWNLHARFLFLGGANWRDGFSALIPWSHPDYPLLLPASIAHFWSCLGREDRSVPAVIGLIFTFSTVGLLFSSLNILRGCTMAMLGSVTLLATPSFVDTGTSQYADIPLAFFFLATIALLCLHDERSENSDADAGGLLFLAGLGASFAAWTKNEGLLFLSAIMAVRLVTTIRGSQRFSHSIQPLPKKPASNLAPKSFGKFLAAALPVLLLIIWFKHSVAPAGDLFTDSAGAFRKILDASRYSITGKWFGKEFLRFGHWVFFPGTLLLAGLYVAVGRTSHVTPPPGSRSSIITLVLTLAGYFVIYLITPYDLYWHLRFSLTRLFLQLWPSAIFLFFLQLRLGLPQPTEAGRVSSEH
jgi:hypothetical protein